MPSRKSLLSIVVLCSFSTAYSAVPQGPPSSGQSPQTRPAPGGQQGGRPPQGGNRPSPGGGGSKPGRPSPGGGGSQPGRPSPGGGNRPGPGGGNRPSPGGGNNNRPSPGRPNPGGGNNGRPPNRPGPGRPPQWGRPPQNRPSYSFRRNDRDYLRRHYLRNLSYINMATRRRFVIGGFFPYGDIGYLSPLPPDVYGYLPPPPPGYSMGYYEGYVVVYDPLTYFIANVIDLVQ